MFAFRLTLHEKLRCTCIPVTSSHDPTATCASSLPYLAYRSAAPLSARLTKTNLARLGAPIVRLALANLTGRHRARRPPQLPSSCPGPSPSNYAPLSPSSSSISALATLFSTSASAPRHANFPARCQREILLPERSYVGWARGTPVCRLAFEHPCGNCLETGPPIKCVSALANCHCHCSRWPFDPNQAAPRRSRTNGRCLRAAETFAAPPETRCARSPHFAYLCMRSCAAPVCLPSCHVILSRHRAILCASSLPYLAYHNHTRHCTTLCCTKANLAGLGAPIVSGLAVPATTDLPT